MSTIFSFFYAYVANLADGMLDDEAFVQAIKDSDWALAYYDGLTVDEQTTFGSWTDAQL